MERFWSDVLKIPLDTSTSNHYRVAASLCLSSSNTISVPSANAIFFHGDRVRETGNDVIERHYDLQKVAEIIVSLINQLASVHHCPRTIVLGFSKGGVVMNQILSEMSSLDTNFAETSSATQEQQLMVEEPTSRHEQTQIIPASKESFLNSISQVHYIDVRLNSSGAYITDHNVVQRISQRLARGANTLRIVLHGTPRQWCDEQRGWILKEKDELVRLLKSQAENSGGRLQFHERFYFADRLADLQIFEIIDAMRA